MIIGDTVLLRVELPKLGKPRLLVMVEVAKVALL
jgi:hypothetical protein